jgi:hypothetical protein
MWRGKNQADRQSAEPSIAEILLGNPAAPDLLRPDHESLPLDKHGDSPVPIMAMGHGRSLDRIPPCHLGGAGLSRLPVSIKAGSADRRQFAPALNTESAL